ncbi:MAG: CPBP family intramembrane metalloprotease [Candidatus Methanoperedens sp.]|nr:CPBP family intramembrane metalloprotease [Candidatus Methanoperedens sp.]
MIKNIKKSILFVSLTFFFSWLIAISYYISGGRLGTTPQATAVLLAYMFVPMMMAIIVQKFIYKEPVKDLGISWRLNRWFLVAWLLPAGMAFATLGVSLLFPGVEYSSEMAGLFERLGSIFTPEQMEQLKRQFEASPVHPIWIALFQGLIAGITINAVAGFGEELGWRGLLQKELHYLGFWKSSAIIGIIWGIWHAPIIIQGYNYPQHPLAGVFMMTIFTLLLSPIFSYVRLKAKSVIAAAIIHGSLNATAGLAIMVIKGGDDLTTGITGLAGFIVLAIVNLAIFAYDRFLAKEPVITGRGHMSKPAY